MRLRKGALMILSLALLLTGCGAREASPDEEALALRTAYLSMTSFQATAEITADYGDRAYQYTAQCEGNAREGSLTVTAPESIAGTGTAWKDGETALDYEGISLETGQLSPDGLSPADALPVILAACQSGAIVESGWTAWGEAENCLYLLVQNPNTDAEESRVAVWADPETGALLQAEILWEENRVIAFAFSQFTLETGNGEAG